MAAQVVASITHQEVEKEMHYAVEFHLEGSRLEGVSRLILLPITFKVPLQAIRAKMDYHS
jgi:hypothetical protein